MCGKWVDEEGKCKSKISEVNNNCDSKSCKMSLLPPLCFPWKRSKGLLGKQCNVKLGKQIGMRMMNDGSIIGTLWVSLLYMHGFQLTWVSLREPTFRYLRDDCVHIFPNPPKLLPYHLFKPEVITLWPRLSVTRPDIIYRCGNDETKVNTRIVISHLVRCADPQESLSVQFKGCHPGTSLSFFLLQKPLQCKAMYSGLDAPTQNCY